MSNQEFVDKKLKEFVENLEIGWHSAFHEFDKEEIRRFKLTMENALAEYREFILEHVIGEDVRDNTIPVDQKERTP